MSIVQNTENYENENYEGENYECIPIFIHHTEWKWICIFHLGYMKFWNIRRDILKID